MLANNGQLLGRLFVGQIVFEMLHHARGGLTELVGSRVLGTLINGPEHRSAAAIHDEERALAPAEGARMSRTDAKIQAG